MTVAKKVWTERMSHQDGCLSREINTNKDSGYTDIACRADKTAADKANEGMANAPAEWFACYDVASIKTVNVMSVVGFEK